MKYFTPDARKLIELGFLQPPQELGKTYFDEIPIQLWQDAYSAFLSSRKEQLELQELRMNRNIELFLKTPGLYVYDPEGRISSRMLYTLYRQWCLAEQLPLQRPRSFFLYVKKHAPQYRLVYAGHIPDSTGKRVRGFYGIRPLSSSEDGTVAPHGTDCANRG